MAFCCCYVSMCVYTHLEVRDNPRCYASNTIHHVFIYLFLKFKTRSHFGALAGLLILGTHVEKVDL